jgi:hypothetical protein
MSRAVQDRSLDGIASRDAGDSRDVARSDPAPSVPHKGGASFSFSHAKLRLAAFILLGGAAPAALGFALSGPLGRWLWLAWLAAVALLMHWLGRRAASDATVLHINERGILDRRLMLHRIAWQEIEAVCPVNVDCAFVVDLRLRWPKTTLAGAGWSARIGATLQTSFNVPAVTINMLSLDGDVLDVLEAVARYRPDLLSAANRRAIRTAQDGFAR